MDCRTALEAMDAYLDGEADQARAADFDAHIATCTACREQMHAHQRHDSYLRSAFAQDRRRAELLGRRVAAQFVPPTRRRASPSGRGMLTALAAAAAGFLLAIAILPIGRPREVAHVIPAPVEATPLAKLTVASGPIQFRCPGDQEWRPLATGAAITRGCRVRTTDAAVCELRTTDGSEVRLNNDSEVCFVSARQLEMPKGQMLSRCAPAPEQFQVQLPDAMVSALGTEFDLHRQEKLTVLTVLEGKTRVDGPDGGTIVERGSAADIVAGRVTDRRTVHDMVAATNWVHAVLVLKGQNDPELARRIDAVLEAIGHEKVERLREPEIRALGHYCCPPLKNYLSSPRSHASASKRQMAARILADLAQPWLIPDLIDLLGDNDAYVRAQIARGLARLTAENLGWTNEAWSARPPAEREAQRQAWRKWWTENERRVPQPPSGKTL